MAHHPEDPGRAHEPPLRARFPRWARPDAPGRSAFPARGPGPGLLRRTVVPSALIGFTVTLLGVAVAWLVTDASQCQQQQPWGCLGVGLLLMAVEPPMLALVLALALRAAHVRHPWLTSLLTVLTAAVAWQVRSPGLLWKFLAALPIVQIPLAVGLLTSLWACALAAVDPGGDHSRSRAGRAC